MREVREDAGDLPVVAPARRKVAREIDEAVGICLDRRQPVAAALADERAAANLAADQAAPFRFGIGPRDGANGDAKLPGKFAVGREAVTGLEASGGDVLGEAIGDGGVARAGLMLKVGQPTCHGDNI